MVSGRLKSACLVDDESELGRERVETGDEGLLPGLTYSLGCLQTAYCHALGCFSEGF